ncbi:Ferric reduction oxidase 5 [Diplonema papillatum]|nr:Ferric reduction oxidase 5 [Diplonema papillatum]
MYRLLGVLSTLAAARAGNLRFSPEFDITWELGGDVVAFNMTCAADGYCAIGFGASKANSDTITCYFLNEVAVCKDEHVGSVSTRPTEDTVQDVTVVDSEGTGDVWWIQFTRALITGDDEDRAIVTNAPQSIIWALGTVVNDSLRKHSSEGRHVVQWAPYFAFNDEFSVTWDVTPSLLIINMTCSEGHYCAIGIGETKTHSDTIICYYAADVVASCEDGHVGAKLTAPTVDAKQDVTVLSAGGIVNGGWWLQLSRPWDTSDGDDLSFVRDGTQSILWAIGDVTDGRFRKHSSEGFAVADWGQGTIVWPEPPQLDPFFAFNDEFSVTWEVTLSSLIINMTCSEGHYCAIGGTTDGQTTVYPLYGFFSWVAYTILVALGAPIFRRKFYSVFVVSHVALSIVTVTFSIMHISGGWRPYLINSVPLTILCLDFAVRTYQKAFTYPVTVSYSGAVTKLVMETCGRRWGPGSYMYISIGEVGFSEAHPFSVVSHHDSGKAVFYVKNMGRHTWTDRLSRLSVDGAEKLFARLEGPYGNLQFDMTKHDKLVLICGGIGITPMLGIAAYMAPAQSALLSWSVRDPSTILFLLEDIEALLAKFTNLRIAISYTGHQSLNEADISSSRLTIDHGRPDFKELILTYADRHSAVAICGPAPLIMTAVAEAKSSHFHLPLHVETFQF